MNEPWFDPNMYAWIPGTLFGVLCGLWGSLMGTLGPQGRAKSAVLGLGWLLLAASLVLLAGGIIALTTGQPYGIWYGLGLPGVLGTVLLSLLMPVAYLAYRGAEERRMQALDL